MMIKLRAFIEGWNVDLKKHIYPTYRSSNSAIIQRWSEGYIPG